MVKSLTAMRETRVPSLGWEYSLEEEMATHFSILAWKIPWMEEPGSLQSMGLQRVRHDFTTTLLETPWTAAHQASLSITISQSLLKLMSIESEMPSNHLILCRPLLLLPSILPIIRVFSNESTLRISSPKYWSFSFNIRPSNEYSEWISFRID